MATSLADISSVDTGVVQSLGSEQTVETPQVETQDAGQDTTLDAGGQGGTQETGEAGESVDGRRGQKAHREAVRAAQQAMPEHAKTIKEMADNTYRLGGYQQVFPKVEEAQQAKDLITALGGIEGASALQERITAYDAQETGLQSGDPAVLDSFFKDYPDGAATLAPHYLEKLEKLNPGALQAAVAPYAVGMLYNSGVFNHIESLVNETDPARVKAGVQQFQQWLQKQLGNVSQLQNSRTQGQGGSNIDKERQSLAQEREKLFTENVNTKIDMVSLPVMNAEVERYAKQEKLTPEQKAYYADALKKAVFDEMNSDETYKKQVKIRYDNKNRTVDTISSYISGEFNRRVKEKALPVMQSTLKLFGRTGTAQTAQNTGQAQSGAIKAGGPKAGANGQPFYVSVKPPDSELNTDHPDAYDNMVRGRAYTKAGKYITWRKPTA